VFLLAWRFARAKPPYMLFDDLHGSAPDIAGKNLANPIAVIMAGVMMLNHIGETQAADRIKNAVKKVVNEGEFVTPDLNPHSKAGAIEMGNAIVEALKKHDASLLNPRSRLHSSNGLSENAVCDVPVSQSISVPGRKSVRSCIPTLTLHCH